MKNTETLGTVLQDAVDVVREYKLLLVESAEYLFDKIEDAERISRCNSVLEKAEKLT